MTKRDCPKQHGKEVANLVYCHNRFVIYMRSSYHLMERRMMGNYQVRCGVGEKVAITSKPYLPRPVSK